MTTDTQLQRARELFEEWLKTHHDNGQFETYELKIMWEAWQAALSEQQAAPDMGEELRMLVWNVVDNLNDTPVNEDWANRTASRLTELLDAQGKPAEGEGK